MHRHAFFRAARTPQPALLRGADVEWLADLDRTGWIVLSRPTALPGREDPVAALLDGNGDGRVRVPEVLAAIDWLRPRLASFDRLFLPFAGLVPDDLRADTPEGKALADLLAQIAPDGTPVTAAALGEARQTRLCAPGQPPLCGMAETFRRLCPSPEDAETQSRKDFESACALTDRVLAWRAALPKGDWTYEDAAAFAALRQPVADYFLACETLRYDPAATPPPRDPAKPLREAPLALPSAVSPGLPLRGGLNPAWRWAAERLAKWTGRDDAVLTPEAWHALCGRFAPLMAWYDGSEICPPGERKAFFDTVDWDDAEGIARLADPALRAELARLIDAEEAKAPLRATFDALERFLTLREGFLRFLRNFVNVADLYPPMADPLFLTGTLFMDGRCCRLCFPVEGDAAAHAKAAEGSRCCLVYCALERKGEAGRTILAVFTAGATGALTVGKRGVFFDLQGRDWEAVACHVAINAISLSEAFVEPWRRIGAACVETARRLLAGKGDAAVAALAPKPAKPAMPPEMASVATLGIALSFVASAAAAIAAAVTNAPLWKTGAVAAGVVLAVSVPSVILAWFRLRNRDLAPILNASGWAINRAIGLTPRLGRFFTRRASLVGRRFVLPCRKE